MRDTSGRFEHGNTFSVPYVWKPGQSGNPAGRPKKKPIRDAIRRLLNTIREDGLSNADVLALRAFAGAMDGGPDAVHWAKFIRGTTEGHLDDYEADEPDKPEKKPDEPETVIETTATERTIEAEEPPKESPKESLNAWLKRATPEHAWDAPHLLLLQ